MNNLRFVSDNNPMLEEAQKMWEYLDKLAESNPEKYRQFINQQVTEGKKYFQEQQPTPIAKLDARLRQPSLWPSLEILLLAWRKLDTEVATTDGYVASFDMLHGRVYVAMTTALASTFDGNTNSAQISKIFDLLESQIEQSSKVQRITIDRKTSKCKPAARTDFTPAQIREIETALEERLSSATELRLPDTPASKSTSSKPLITEIDAPKPGITYTSERLVDDSGIPLLRFHISLPGVRSANECTCDITARALHLLVHATGQSLDITWPCKVIDDDARAKFVKSTSTLLVTVPICDKD